MSRPPLLALLAGMAGVAIVANGAAISAPGASQDTRMGVSIKQSVKDRDRAAAERNRALDLREQAARAAEERLKAEMQTRPAGAKTAAAKEEEQEGPYDSLARIYQTMKPAKAARVFEQLELEVQVQVAQRMRDRATAAILASMSPDAAARLSMAMAGKTAQRPPIQATQPQPAARPAQAAPRAARPATTGAPAAR